MAWMSDEQYLLKQDTKEKSITARSARSTRTHCGKGGAVKLPSDYMSAKELKSMNSECKTYRMNSPITWDEFKTWPDEHKITYVKLLRAKYGVPDVVLAEAMGASPVVFGKYIRCLKLGLGKGAGAAGRHWEKSDQREQFFAWWHGIKIAEKPVEEEAETVEPYEDYNELIAVGEEATDEKVVEVPMVINGDKVSMEEAVESIRKSEAWPLFKPAEECIVLPKECVEGHTECAAPIKGEMTFEGNVDDILRTIRTLLGGKKGHIEIEWRLFN